MLKNKFKLIVVLTLLILCLTTPFVRAEDETVIQPRSDEATDVTSNDETAIPTAEDDGIMPISITEEDSQPVTENKNSSILNSDAYLSGTNVVVDYPVDGNLFVFAETVTIKSQIGGDAFIFANHVIIEEEGYIYSSLFTIADDIKISGLIYDLYAIANDTTIDGYVSRDIKVYTGTLNVNGLVGRNAFVCADSIVFPSTSTDGNEENAIIKGKIYGDLNYSSNSEMSIPEGAVEGKTTFSQLVQPNKQKSIQSYILELGTFICTVAVIWLLLQWIAPKFQNKAGELLSKKTLSVVGFGILAPIVTVIAFVILLLLNISSAIAFLLFFTLILFICVSLSIFTISANNLICKKLKVEKPMVTFGILIITSAVLWLITLIPTAGSLISFVAKILGLGIIIKSIIPSKETNNDKKVEEAEKSSEK